MNDTNLGDIRETPEEKEIARIVKQRDEALAQLKIDQWIKGQWKCPTCNFVLSKNVLSIRDGNIYANAEPFNVLCPNDGTAMKPLTFKESYHDICKVCEQQVERAVKAETELAEAQQWIDSEPDWKDKYMANYQQLILERDSLREQLNNLKQYNSINNETIKRAAKERDLIISQMAVIVEGLSNLCEYQTATELVECVELHIRPLLTSTPLAAKELLERLDWYKIEYEALKSVISQCLEAMGPTGNVCLRESIINQKERVERMEKALEPFARIADELEDVKYPAVCKQHTALYYSTFQKAKESISTTTKPTE